MPAKYNENVLGGFSVHLAVFKILQIGNDSVKPVTEEEIGLLVDEAVDVVELRKKASNLVVEILLAV